MPIALPSELAAMPTRIDEITSRFDPSSTPRPTTSDDFANLLADQIQAQSSASQLAALTGSTDSTDTTDSTDSASSLGSGDSWMSSLSSLLSQLQGSGSSSSSTGVSGTDVVSDATQYLGVPYKWGGTNPQTGLDCSGFVQRAYGDLGISLPRTAAQQAQMGTPVDSLADAQPGDLIAFGQPVDHIAIYVGNGNMIEAPHTGDVVKIAPVSGSVTAIRRIVGTSGLGATTATGSPGSTSAGAAPYQAMFQAAGAKYGVSPALLSSVARVESGYNASARSSAGAVGLMQFMPSTAAGMGFDPTDPAQSIDGAARYLSAQIQRFGSVPLALAAYNAGPGAVQRYGGVPPYPETQRYVSNVLAGAGVSS